MDKMNEIIKIEGLRKRFGDNEVLKGITTSVRQGEVVAIIGPSGCGKSTFLRSINLLEEPTEGKIYIDGMDITSWDVDINKMRQRVGMVFQQFNLFPNMTIRRNIMMFPVAYRHRCQNAAGLSIHASAQRCAELLLQPVGPGAEARTPAQDPEVRLFLVRLGT